MLTSCFYSAKRWDTSEGEYMKHLVIVVDDENLDRRLGYERLADKVSELIPGFEIDVHFVEDPNQTKLMARQNYYSGAIVDAVLEKNWPCYNLTKALRDLGEEIPIALLSERWDDTNSEQIDDAWKRGNCRTFLHWRDINPEGNGQIDYSVRAFVSMITDSEQLDVQLKLGPNDPIRILHISDIQTGGFDEKNLKLEANRCADHILEHCSDCSPTFVAFTGDVAEHGRPAQYKSAKEWLSYFFERLGLGNLPARSLLYVPGNHDVNLCLAAGSRVQLFDDKKKLSVEMKLSNKIQQNELLDFAYVPFRNFLSEINDCPLLAHDIGDHSLAWVDSRHRHLGVIFYGVNTAQPISAFGLPSRQVDPNALARIGVELKQMISSYRDDKPLIVGLGHHCPVSSSGDSAVENHEAFNSFFRGGVKTGLFLHGHVHSHDLSYSSNDGLRLLRSCATTLTKKEEARPKDSIRGFNLLKLHRENNMVTSLSASSFGWIVDDIKELKKGNWILYRDGMFREG
jgi:hypothetical protein